MLSALLFLVMTGTHAALPQAISPDALLARAESSSHNDHARFLSALHQLKQQRANLTQIQQQQLLYWEAWKAQSEEKYSRATRMLKQVIEQADDPSLVTRAKLKLVINYMINRRYVDAFTLSNALIADMDKIKDPELRGQVLLRANDILIWQKQYNQALRFANKLKATATTPRSRCEADYAEVETLLQRGGVLTSSNPQFRQTVNQCLSSGMLLTANALRLDWASLMDDEGRTRQALAFLDRIEPDIKKVDEHSHIAALYVTRAQAYLIEGKYALAGKWARATLSANTPNSFNWIMQAAYKVLYNAQAHTGHYQAALGSYKEYMAQYKKSTSDAKAQALAYQIVKQEVLAKRLKLEELSKQNRILQLRQSLDGKIAETNRLYITLLLLVLASIIFWTWRIKHSQIRFRKMARHDDLTGIFNRQYFFEQAEHTLQRLHKTGGHACLLILDMDHFKRINDVYGHVAGDSVLKHVVRTCVEELRDSDVFGRLGGEEFAILMPGCNLAQGKQIGDRVRMSLANSPVRILESESVTFTSSIGLAGTEAHGHALKPLLIAADEALYEAKRAGRNRLATRSDPSTTACS